MFQGGSKLNSHSYYRWSHFPWCVFTFIVPIISLSIPACTSYNPEDIIRVSIFMVIKSYCIICKSSRDLITYVLFSGYSPYYIVYVVNCYFVFKQGFFLWASQINNPNKYFWTKVLSKRGHNDMYYHVQLLYFFLIIILML